MKCNVCGAYNKPEYRKCIRCSASLIDDADSPNQEKILLEHQSPLKNTPTFREAIIVEEKKEEVIKKDIRPGTHEVSPEEINLWEGNRKKKRFLNRDKKSVPIISLKNESEPDEKDKSEDSQDNARTRRIKPVARGTNLDKISKIREGQEVHIILPPEEQEKQKKTKKSKKTTLKWGRIILVSTVAGVLIIGMIVGFVFLFKGVSTGISQIFPGHDDVPNGGVPLVERILINGETWHKITFYGEDGERVLINDPIRSLSIQNREAVLLLDDSSFIPEQDITATIAEELDEAAQSLESGETVEQPLDAVSNEFVQVALEASLFSKDGDETLLYVEPYKIPVPASPLKIVYPTEPNIKVNYTQVFVKIKVTPGSRVIIDNINLTDKVDSQGYVQKYVNLKEGSNEILVVVETTKHRRTTETIYATRPELDVSIELKSPPSEHAEDEVWISGTVEAETTISTDTFHTAAVPSYEAFREIELEDGTIVEVKDFKFKYALTDYGWNEIEITATAADGRQSTIIHRVQRTPDHRQYTKLAWPINTDADYDYLSQSTTALIGQIYECKGEVISREDTDQSRMYLYNVGTSEDTKYIMLEYTGTQNFEVGKTYKIYADVVGVYDNYPLLKGRFIYDWERPEDVEPTEEVTTEP